MSPASARPLPLTSTGAAAVLVSVTLGVVARGVLVLDGPEVSVAPVGSRAVARAVLATEPASTSAWVIV